MNEEARHFPRQEDRLLGLAQEMILGFPKNRDVYPDPPVDVEVLQKHVDDCLGSRDEADEAHAEAKQKTAAKDKNFRQLAEVMKTDIRYAENKVNFDDAELKKIGWHGRKAKGRLPPPGDISGLTASSEGDEGGRVILRWSRPSKGGKTAMYTVEQREPPGKIWRIAAHAFEREAEIDDQKAGTVQEFRVTASNKAGTGNPSNTVAVTF